MIVKIVDRWKWYGSLIQAGCSDHLLKTAFTIASFVNSEMDRQTDSPKDLEVYGWAFPTREQIAEKTGAEIKTISAHTKQLEDSGWIKKDIKPRASGRKTFYALQIGNQFEVKKRQQSNKSIANLKTGKAKSDGIGTPSPMVSDTASPMVSGVPSPMVSGENHILESVTESTNESLTKVVTENENIESENLEGYGSPAEAGAENLSISQMSMSLLSLKENKLSICWNDLLAKSDGIGRANQKDTDWGGSW